MKVSQRHSFLLGGLSIALGLGWLLLFGRGYLMTMVHVASEADRCPYGCGNCRTNMSKTVDSSASDGNGKVNLKLDDIRNSKPKGEAKTSDSETKGDLPDENSFPEVLVITNGTIKWPGAKWMDSGDISFRTCPNLESWMKCHYDPDAHKVWNQSEAVLMFAHSLTKENPVPSYRPQRQKWIFFESEPPTNTWSRVKVLNDIWGEFNFTMTYMSDSDLPYSMYKIVCNDTPDYKPLGVNFAEKKTKLVAWWVSNCKSNSQRERYVDEMKKYIKIDVMGKCGKFKEVCGAYAEDFQCVSKMLDSQYKFYLAFENSFCKEYYTEKISKCLKINIVPVVMGLHNYSEFMPPKSYIDVRDFKAPKALAEYLKYLDSNDTAYNEYIENKRKIECNKLDPLPYKCKLCRYLHENRHRRQLAQDTRQSFSIHKLCTSPKLFFKNISHGIYSRFHTNGIFGLTGEDQEWDVST